MFLKKLYDRCVELARHKFSKPLLGFVAFIESFFFPVPPDLMIVPMVVAKREDYLKIFLIATTGSVLGGLFGYMLGVFFLDTSMVIIEFYGYENKVFEIQDAMSTKGGFITWLGIMFAMDLGSSVISVFVLWRYCKTNVLKIYLQMQNQIWAILAIEQGYIISEVR